MVEIAVENWSENAVLKGQQPSADHSFFDDWYLLNLHHISWVNCYYIQCPTKTIF